MNQFYPKSNILIQNEQKISSEFSVSKDKSIFVLFETKDKSSWLAEKNFIWIKNISQKFEQDPQISKVTSISTLQNASSSSDQIEVGQLFDGLTFDKRQKIAKNHPLVKPLILNKTESMTLMVLNFSDGDLPAIKSYSEKLQNYFSNQFPQYQIRIGGLSVLQAEMGQILKQELVRSALIGLLVFIFGLFLIYKKTFSLFPVVICLVFVNTVIIGALAALEIPLNVLSSTLPILVSLGVISLVVHIQGHFNKSRNILATYKDLFWENLLAVFISGLGFLFLRMSDSQMIKNYGTLVAFAAFSSWFLVHLIYWPISYAFKSTDFRSWLHKPALWTLAPLKFKKQIITATIVVFAFGFFGAFNLNWNSLVLDDLPKDQAVRKTTEIIDSQFGGTIEMNFVITLKSGNWLEPISLNKLNGLLHQIKRLPVVGSVASVSDIFKSMSAKPPQRWLASKAEVNDANILLSMGSENPLNQYLSVDRKKVLLKIRYKDNSSNKVQKSFGEITNLAKKNFPDSEVTRGGFAEQFHVLNQQISKDLVYNFWHALLMATLILVVVFKNWRLAIIACLPNLLPPMALLAWVSTQQLPLKPSIAIIFSIAIGMAFTNTIYILGRIVKLKREKGYQSYIPLKRALIEEGNPCLVATVLVLLGFFVFLFSQFGVNRLFGQYMMLSVTAAFIGDLIFMPSLIQYCKKWIIPVVLLFVVFPIQSEAINISATEVLEQAKKSLLSTDDTAKISMKIIEADGQSKNRELVFKRKFHSGKNQTLVKILSPVDQKGAGMLSVVGKDSEQQWIYLPGSKQVRRFISKNKEEGVLGSELSPQDLDFNTVKSAKARLIKVEKIGSTEFTLIEVASKSNETAYSKAQLWINMTNYTPARIDYFGANGIVVKRVEFFNYIAVNKVQRAQKIVIKNLKNKRSTELLFSKLKVNSGLSDTSFTQRALASD